MTIKGEKRRIKLQADVNIDKLIPRITATLNKLLAKTDFDSLTVKDIAKEAGFSRQYFYRAFSDKYALAVEIFAYDMKRGIEDQFTPRLCHQKTLEYIMRNSRIYKSIFQSSYSSYLFDVMFNSGMEFVRAMVDYMSVSAFTKEQDNRLRLYFLGVTSMLVKSLTGGEHFTKDELDKIFYENVPPFLEFLKEATVTKEYILHKIAKYRDEHIV